MNEICPELQQALGVAVLAARLPASSLAPQTSQMVSRHRPTTCEGKVNHQVSDFLFSLGFSLIGTYLMFQARSANRGQMFEAVSRLKHALRCVVDGLYTWMLSEMLIFSNEKLSVVIAFP